MMSVRFAALLVASAFAAVPARAADMPEVPASIPAPPAHVNWTGFYVGVQLGYGFGRDRLTQTGLATGAVAGTGTIRTNGPLAGLHIGYNMQVQNFVVGLEGDVDYANLDGVLANAGGGVAADLRFTGSLRGRIGVAFDRALVYASAGVAIADLRYTLQGAPVAPLRDTRVGYTLGGGVEYAFTPNLSGRLDYRFTDLGSVTFQVPAVGSALRLDPAVQTLRFGASVRF